MANGYKKILKNKDLRLAILRFLRFVPDTAMLHLEYFIKLRKRLNLKNPKTFNEKLQWLKLHNRKPIHTTMVDKIAVKPYVAAQIGEEYVIPTLGVWDRFEDIDFDSLPEQFVLKCNHDSGSVVLCRDKASFDREQARRLLTGRLAHNAFYFSREWPYKDVPPRILAEAYLQDGECPYLPVYKIFCFDGQPKIIQTIQNDKQPDQTVDYFDTDWNRLDIRQDFPGSETLLPKPEALEKMLELAGKLSAGEPFLRMDFYVVNGSIYFSEFNFFADAGFGEFTPGSWDTVLGQWLTLPAEKKYVFFIGTLNQGGGERVISILTKKMCEDGLPVEILIYHDEDPFYELHPDVKLVRVRKETGSGNLLKNLLWMRRYFRENAKAVISFLAPFNMLALVATACLRLPVIVADRNDPRQIPRNPVVRKARDILYHFASGVVLQTRHNQAYFSKAVQKKSTVIYNPIDLGEKAELALRTPKRPRIVSVGRLMPQKNQAMLIDAFARLRQQYPDYTLTIYGEGPARPELEAQIARLGLTDAVELPGSVKDVPERIADAELFVLSSYFEGMPNALIEAMCLGLPVISTKVSGATDLVDGENGLLTEVGDTDELYRAMDRMLADADLRTACAQKAVDLNEKLQLDQILSQWLEFVAKYRAGRDKL